MEITKEQHKETTNHLKKWYEAFINPIPLEKNLCVWHYTNGTSLLKILESGTLLSTQVACLNDSTELQYAMNLFRNSLFALLPTFEKDPTICRLIDRFSLDPLEETDEPENARYMYFVTCFSEVEDDLAMWRSYAGGENGYSIGFKADDLNGAGHRALIGRVNYDTETHKNLATTVAKKAIEFYKLWKLEQKEEDYEEWDRVFIKHWTHAIAHLAPFLKDEGFASEREIRIAIFVRKTELNEIMFFQKRSMMTMHRPLIFSSEKKKDTISHLPIHRILVGPGRHKQISLASLNTLLRKHEYSEVTTGKSTRPYQET